jgi:hypothetical protein
LYYRYAPKDSEICDPFAGTAASALAVLEMNENGYDYLWYGCENDKELHAAAWRRLENKLVSTPVLPGFFIFLFFFFEKNNNTKNHYSFLRKF